MARQYITLTKERDTVRSTSHVKNENYNVSWEYRPLGLTTFIIYIAAPGRLQTGTIYVFFKIYVQIDSANHEIQ